MYSLFNVYTYIRRWCVHARQPLQTVSGEQQRRAGEERLML